MNFNLNPFKGKSATNVTDYIFFTFAAIFFVAGIVGALYTFFIWGIYDPIMDIAQAIDSNTLSATMVTKEVLKFFFKSAVSFGVFVIGCIAAGLFVAIAER